MSWSVAARAFFAALTRKDASKRIEEALRGGASTRNAEKSLENETSSIKTETSKKIKKAETSGKSTNSEASKKLVSAEKSARATGGAVFAQGAPDVSPSALALLAALQREARFVDFVKEPLGDCDEATLGAAARTVRDRCATVLERCFEIRPLTAADEGATVSLDSEAAQNSARVRVSSSADLERGVSGRLVHSGWIAKKCATPRWSGTPEDAFVLAPMEIDVESER